MEYTKGKIVFLGDTKVGKTCIINCYNQMDVEHVEPTVPVNSVKTTVYLDGKEVNLNLWDTAGQENYRCLLPLYMRGAQIGIIVFDLSNKESYLHVEDWIEIFRKQNDCKIVVVGNKSDLQKDVDTDKIHSELMEKGYPFFQTSAKSGEGIDVLFHEIAAIVDKEEGDQQSPSIIQPESTAIKESEKSCC